MNKVVSTDIINENFRECWATSWTALQVNQWQLSLIWLWFVIFCEPQSLTPGRLWFAKHVTMVSLQLFNCCSWASKCGWTRGLGGPLPTCALHSGLKRDHAGCVFWWSVCTHCTTVCVGWRCQWIMHQCTRFVSQGISNGPCKVPGLLYQIVERCIKSQMKQHQNCTVQTTRLRQLVASCYFTVRVACFCSMAGHQMVVWFDNWYWERYSSDPEPDSPLISTSEKIIIQYFH